MLIPVNIMHINFHTLQVILTDINYELEKNPSDKQTTFMFRQFR